MARVVRLLNQNRPFSGSEGIKRAPQLGDVGPVVHVHSTAAYIVESVHADGTTACLADFEREELEFVLGL
jgi:hypothetical protein